MLISQQLNVLKKSNETLAILGFYRNEDEQIRYVFKNAGGKDGNINVSDFFAKLKPELSYLTEDNIKIGEESFRKNKLYAPLKAQKLLKEGELKDKNFHSQPILFDSPLLNGTIYSGEEATAIQEQGKTVFKQLVTNLDTIAYFTHSCFTKSLLKIAKHYLFEEANRNLEHKLADDAQWYKTINSDNSFCSRIVQYLTAYEQDEPKIETAFRKYLKTLTPTSDKRTYTDEQVDKLAEALLKCKRVMLDEQEDDLSWKKIALSDQFTWLKNYASDPKYGISHPEISNKVGNKNFLAYYKYFVVASNAIHRIVRTPPLHSMVVCWLAGKYRKWDSQERHLAAREMYRIGVEGQKDRKYSESSEGSLRNSETVEREANNVKMDEQRVKDENHEILNELVKENIKQTLSPSIATTREDLYKRASKTYKKLNFLLGGEARKILEKSYEFNEIFEKYHQCILSTDLDEDTEPEEQIAIFLERLQKKAVEDEDVKKFSDKFSNFDIREFREIFVRVIDKAEEQLKDVKEKNLAPKEQKNYIKEQIKTAFVSQFARTSLTSFSQEYGKNKDQIAKEGQIAVKLYEQRNRQQVNAKKEEGMAGAPVFVLTQISSPDMQYVDPDIKTERKKNIQKEAQANAQAESTLSVNRPKPIELEEIPVGQELDVNNAQNQKIGSCKIGDNNIELLAEGTQTVEQLTNDGTFIAFKNERKELQQLDISQLKNFSKQEDTPETNINAQAIVDEYEQLSISVDRMLEKYSDEDESDGFNRSYRSLLLCEYIQAEPRRQSQLGRKDLSFIVSLVVDTVEHLGKLDDPTILNEVLSQKPEYLELLKKINFSEYYPIKKAEEMATILQYHNELSKQLYEVKDYLQELAEIKNFFKIMQDTDLEIVFINSTMDEYEDRINELDEYIYNTDKPSVVYLTSQSNPEGRSIADGLDKTAKNLATLIDTNADANIQIPIFISSQELPVDKIPLPSICPTEKLNLNKFAFLHTSETPQKDKFNITVNNWEQPQNYYLLLSAAIMLSNSSTTMGSISKFPLLLTSDIKNLYDISIRKNQTVVELLRQLWLSPQCKLLDNLIFTKWLNLVLLAKHEENPSIKEKFSSQLRKVWQPKDKDLSQICRASFSTVKELAEIPARIYTVKEDGSMKDKGSLEEMKESIGGKYCTIIKEETYKLKLPWTKLFEEKLN